MNPSNERDSRRRVMAAGLRLAATATLPKATSAGAVAPSAQLQAGTMSMSSNTFTTKDGAEIFFKDWGTGQPVVFHHGWPLSADDWDAQMLFFLAHGYRVIAHDRRGHGRSSQTDLGNDMDTYAADVARP